LGSFAVDALVLLPAALAEEIAFRGYLQRVLTAWRGPAAGVLVTAVLFALFHSFNPNLLWPAMLNTFLAGVVFAWATERSGTIWLAVGLHFGWNLAQGSLLGMPVSGLPWDGLLSLGTGGPHLLTGAAYGPEGGLLAMVAFLLLLLPVWAVTRRPRTVAGECRRQRAAVEMVFGPMPHRHHNLTSEPGPFYDDFLRAVKGGNREGEVVLLLRQPEGTILLHAKSTYPEGVYRLPSGGIRRAEGVIEAAQREALEETGLQFKVARPLGFLTYRLREGRRRLFFHSWLVEGEVEDDPFPQDVEERIVGYHWIPLDMLAEVAAALRSLPPGWDEWGKYRALAHDAARDIEGL
jgi:8-oxo-dGTP pyrophosphatase MutT (NUDIX family)